MNTSRTAIRNVSVHPARRGTALGLLLGGVVALVWLGAILHTLVSWIL